jgi:hypothetical protein
MDNLLNYFFLESVFEKPPSFLEFTVLSQVHYIFIRKICKLRNLFFNMNMLKTNFAVFRFEKTRFNFSLNDIEEKVS